MSTGGGAGAAVTVTAHHDDGGTMVRVYVADVQTDQWYVVAGEDWRAGVPAGATVHEYQTGV